MRKLRSLAAFAALFVVPVAVLIMAGVASKSDAFPNWHQVKFRTQQLGIGGYVDSMVTRNASGSRVDTTATIEKWEWTPLTGDAIRGAQSASIPDTVAFFALLVTPSTSGQFAQSGDSINVVTQVSLDGKNWVTATVTDNSIAGGPATSVEAVVELASSNTYGLLYEQVSDDAANGNGILTTLAGATAPSDQALWAFPFIRFIIVSDLVGEYEAKVGYWTYGDLH